MIHKRLDYQSFWEMNDKNIFEETYQQEAVVLGNNKYKYYV